MADARKPRLQLAQKTLPQGLLQALTFFFEQDLSGIALVGGTALAGFYAGHRRSDDLDLFARDEASFQAGILAARALSKIGVSIDEKLRTAQYLRAFCELQGHRFTLDLVLDPNVFQVGSFIALNKIVVADLPTLLMMKAATLIGRCGEKDLYDLLWLFGEFKDLTPGQLLEAGCKIDGGLNCEGLLIALGNALLRADACGFAEDFGVGKKQVFEKIKKLRRELLQVFRHLAESSDLSDDPSSQTLHDLIRKIKRLRG